MKSIHSIAFILVVIGGLNWLLKVFGWDLEAFLGAGMIVNTVYVLVGLSAVYLAVTHKSTCKHCEASPAAPSAPQM